MHQSLLVRELRGRLDLIRRVEVDAAPLTDSVDPSSSSDEDGERKDEPPGAPPPRDGTPALDDDDGVPAPPGAASVVSAPSAPKEEDRGSYVVPATFLSELRGALPSLFTSDLGGGGDAAP
jgi:hypothetical protein